MSEKPRCCATAYDPKRERYNRYRQCVRPGVVERDGKHYCRQHDPEAVRERERKSVDRLNAELDEDRRVRRLNNAAPVLLVVCEDLLKLYETRTVLSGDSHRAVVERARAVIAEARGTKS